MRLQHASTHSSRLGVTATLLTVTLTGCGDSPLTPDQAGAQEASTRAMFAEILEKLESIEDRIDSLETTVDASAGGALVLTGLPAAQLDSVLALASFLAVDATSGAWELCGHDEVHADFGLELGGEAEGKAMGSLGAWAGTGGFAGGEVTAKGAVGGEFKLELGGGIEYCFPLGGEAPPVRAAAAAPARSPGLDQVRATLEGITTQFNLTPATLNTSLDGVRSAIAAPGSITFAGIGDYIALPPSLASMAGDPLGTASGRLQDLSTTAQSALCSSSSWGPNVATVIADACAIIGTGGLTNITALADITSTYPAVQTAVSTVCGRVNTIGLQRLVIPSWDVTFPLGIGTVNVFPGYNQRLFPSYTSVACP